jgi:hypothetical protein
MVLNQIWGEDGLKGAQKGSFHSEGIETMRIEIRWGIYRPAFED